MIQNICCDYKTQSNYSMLQTANDKNKIDKQSMENCTNMMDFADYYTYVLAFYENYMQIVSQ